MTLSVTALQAARKGIQQCLLFKNLNLHDTFCLLYHVCIDKNHVPVFTKRGLSIFLDEKYCVNFLTIILYLFDHQNIDLRMYILSTL